MKYRSDKITIQSNFFSLDNIEKALKSYKSEMKFACNEHKYPYSNSMFIEKYSDDHATYMPKEYLLEYPDADKVIVAWNIQLEVDLPFFAIIDGWTNI